jgi:RNA polymerase sigma-70 factor, ECF subfamily
MGNPRDEELFARLLEHARPRLQAMFKLYRVAPEDKEDILQEAILALWRKRAQVKDYEAWLLSAVRMECLRYRRRGRRQIYSAVDEPALERLADHVGLAETEPSLYQDLRKLVRRLPTRHRALLHLRYGLGLTPEETASQLGYRPASLKKTTTRCLHALRSQLLRRPTLCGRH